jgi:hypothetical protein
VLVAGGCNDSGCLDSAELYDPITGTWSFTGSLNVPRGYYTATLLPNGKVLVAGGFNSGFVSSAELYDPVAGTWSFTGNLNVTRADHSATLLPDGKVLVAGGWSFEWSFFQSTELYDPATGTWSFTGNINTARQSGHTQTLLPSGKVLVAGGTGNSEWSFNNLASCELYDPNTGTWSLTGSLNVARFLHTATLLPNGNVLVTGGENQDSGVNKSAELYNPTTGTWSYIGSLSTGRLDHTATLLPNGEVLVAGGWNAASALDSAEVYDPATGNWSGTAKLNGARERHTAVLLQSGKVLVVGGGGGTNNGRLLSAELYDSGSSMINPIGGSPFFIRQQYLDFLVREPDAGGSQFYLDILNGCNPADVECVKYTRGALSANFFRSPEFQQKGSFVMYLYMVGLGQRPVTVAELSDQDKVDRPHFSEFMTDLQAISDPNDDKATVSAKKDALTVTWLQRTEVAQRFPLTLTDAQFIQKLVDTAGVSLANQSTLVASLNAGTMTRAQALRAAVESAEVDAKFYKQAFVTMEYFGYLRRDPEVCVGSPDPAQCGYLFHNARFQLSADPDFLENAIVRGFIESPEYRGRFGPS